MVVGGADGLGRASAELIPARGGAVMVADLNEANAKVAAERIRATGGDAAASQVDVSNEDQVAAVVEATVREFGRLDGAYNSAGIPGRYTVAGDTDVHDWQRTVDVNLTGTFFCVKHQAAYMAQHGGSIVNTASGAALLVPDTPQSIMRYQEVLDTGRPPGAR